MLGCATTEALEAFKLEQSTSSDVADQAVHTERAVLPLMEWYHDDSQIFVKDEHVDPFLEALDSVCTTRGAARSTGDSPKSVARRLGVQTQDAASTRSWSDYVTNSCRTPAVDEAPELLQAPVGPFGDYSGAMRKALQKSCTTIAVGFHCARTQTRENIS